MSYRYNPYTDTFTHIDDEPNIAVGTPQIPFIVKEIDLTERCIEQIAEKVAKRLRETCNNSEDDTVIASKTGKWIDKWYCSNMSGYEYAMKCSECGKPTYCISLIEPMPNYCPNCGARMKEDGE